MGDHFWPSIYPGIAVGLLYGLSLGGWRNALLGALGGLAAAFLAFLMLGSLFAEEGLLPLAALIAVSVLGAYAVTRAAAAVLRAARAAPP